MVNIFETGRTTGNYSAISVIPGDDGHLSYGRSQAALGSGSLQTLLENYCARPDASFAAALRPYLARIAAEDPHSITTPASA